MNTIYDFAIIGGGIIGVTTAYELASKGAKVILVEKGNIGEEQSGRNWGWIRRVERDGRENDLAQVALEKWRFYQSKIECGFRQKGLLRIFSNECDLEKAVFNAESLDKSHGYQFEFLPPAKVYEKDRLTLNSYAAGALWAPNEACAEPDMATKAIAKLAKQEGATILTQEAVMDLLIESGRLKGLITQTRTIRAHKILIAAGAWSRQVAKLAKTNLPQAYVKQNVCSAKIKSPFSLSLLSGKDIAVRQRIDGNITVGCRGHMQLIPSLSVMRNIKLFWPIMSRMRPYFTNIESLSSLATGVCGGHFHKLGLNKPLNPSPKTRPLIQAVEKTQKTLKNDPIKIAKKWAGIIDGTPDAVPILGRLACYPNLFIATGLSGHGFGIGPGVGYAMAEILMYGKSEIDISPLSMERFNEPLDISVTF